MGAGSLRTGTSISTGMGRRSARARTAGARPCWVRIAGCRPAVSSRRSSIPRRRHPGPGQEFPRPLRRGLPALLGKLKADEGGDQALLGTVVQVPGNALARGVGCGDQARARRDELLLRPLAVGDVAHVGGEGQLPGRPVRVTESSTGNSAPSARMAGISIRRSRILRPRLQIAGEAAPVRLPQCRRHDHLREVAAEHFLRPVAEGPLERAIHVGHPGVPVNADDRVQSGLENGALPCLARGEHGRPRLGDLTFPVSLAPQFRLGNAVQPGKLDAEHCGGMLKCGQVSLGRGASGVNQRDGQRGHRLAA